MKARHAKELAEAERENAILARLTEIGLPEPRVCIQKDSTWLTWGDSYSGAGVPTGTLTALAAALPGLPMVWYHGTFAGITTQAERDASTEEYKTEGPAAPWWVETEHDGRAVLHWRATLGGEGVRVNCHLSYTQGMKTGGVSAHRKEFKGGYSYECKLRQCAPEMYTIENADGVPVAEFGGPGCFLYAQGSPEAMSRSMLTWTPIDADIAPTVADFVRALTN